MSNPVALLQKLLSTPSTRQGTVMSVNGNTVTVATSSGTVVLPVVGASSYKAGQEVTVRGGAVSLPRQSEKDIPVFIL